MIHREYLYNTAPQLLKRLKTYCAYPHQVRNHVVAVDPSQCSWPVLQPQFDGVIRGGAVSDT